MILEDRVISGALKDSVIQRSAFPLISQSRDPIREVRRKLKFEASYETCWASVSFESTDPREAAAVVNSVTRSFLACYHDFTELYSTIKKIDARVDHLRTFNKDTRGDLDRLTQTIAANGAKGEVAAIIDRIVGVEAELAELESAIPEIPRGYGSPQAHTGSQSRCLALTSTMTASNDAARLGIERAASA